MSARERYRMARNIRPGMEVRTYNRVTSAEQWIEVTSALHIQAAGEKVSVISLANGDQFSIPPTDDVMSR